MVHTPANPLVSIMLVVKGCAVYLEDTLLSLLGQTLQDFEVVVVSDSLDSAAQTVMDHCAVADDRIRVFEQRQPGLAAARNQAMSHARGKYCAVADADDISLPQRLEKQVAFLEAHPDISLCGAWIQIIGAEPAQIRRTPAEDALIRAQMPFLCPFAHSTVMWRRQDILETGQTYRWDSAEDYDLWVRLAGHIRFANIPDVLVHYRVHPGQRSHLIEGSAANDERLLKIRQMAVENIGLQPDAGQMHLHNALAGGAYQPGREFVLAAENWLLQLKQANRMRSALPEPQFGYILAENWWLVCLKAAWSPWLVWRFLASPLNRNAYPGVREKARFILRAAKEVLIRMLRKH